MEGYRTWEGSGGKNEGEKETVFYFPDEKLAVAAAVIITAFWQ